MSQLLFGAFEPDIASVNTNRTSYVLNVFPRVDGYGPINAIEALSSPLPSRCLGAFTALGADGQSVVFAGTNTALFRFNASSGAWLRVSKAGGYAVNKGDMWGFAQMGANVVAVAGNNPPQVYNLSSDTAFHDLAGSPPNARGVAVVGDFLVLFGLSSNSNRIHWSGINDIEWWTPGSHNCDYQDFPDGGFVRGMAGGEFGLVFQDTAIRRMVFAPGSDVIFQFQRISEDRGVVMPYSIARAHQTAFFLSQDGFYKIDLSGGLTPIGASRVDATVFSDADMSDQIDMIACDDPGSKRIMWAYRSNDNRGTSYLDRVVIYDWALDKWSQARLSVQYLARVVPPVASIDDLDGLGSIDGLTDSFDNMISRPTPYIAAVMETGELGLFTGAPIEAIMDTPEGMVGNGERMFVQNVAPITDAKFAKVAMEARERLMDARHYDVETTMSPRTGFAGQRSSGRYQTVRLRIPAGGAWSFARGVNIDARKDGAI